MQLTPLRGGGGRWVTPLCGLYRYVRLKGYGSLATLVVNRLSFLYSSLELCMFFRRDYVFIIIDKTINKSHSESMFVASVSAAKVINRVSNFWARILWSGPHTPSKFF